MTPDRKEEHAVRVYFPCVQAGGNHQMLSINCFFSKELKGTVKVISGIDDEAARRIIGAARYHERDHKAGQGVMVLFSNPFFCGQSYGLALAVADKLARYIGAGNWSTIIATGQIPAEGGGQVEAIQGFSEKIELVSRTDDASTLFLYPQKNVISVELQRQVERLQHQGITCKGVSHIDELMDVVWTSPRYLANHKKKIKKLGGQFSLFFSRYRYSWRRKVTWVTLIVIILLLELYFFTSQPKQNKNISEKPAVIQAETAVVSATAAPKKINTPAEKPLPALEKYPGEKNAAKEAEKETYPNSAIESMDVDAEQY